MDPWTTQDINDLKRYFLEEKRLKDMGYLLGRSVTSINKALTRFKIRAYRQNKTLVLKNNLPHIPKIEWKRKIECDMNEVFAFVKSCMARRLKYVQGEWIYHGSKIDTKRAMVLINAERSFRKFPLFYFEY